MAIKKKTASKPPADQPVRTIALAHAITIATRAEIAVGSEIVTLAETFLAFLNGTTKA